MYEYNCSVVLLMFQETENGCVFSTKVIGHLIRVSYGPIHNCSHHVGGFYFRLWGVRENKISHFLCQVGR